MTISGTSTGYDVASACNPQPESLSPGAVMTSNFYLTAHTTYSLLVNVRASATGALIPGATVTLTRTGLQFDVDRRRVRTDVLPEPRIGEQLFDLGLCSRAHHLYVEYGQRLGHVRPFGRIELMI